jgi:light-regulated signal transduction histidine kinase (bacteriophytochrome)
MEGDLKLYLEDQVVQVDAQQLDQVLQHLVSNGLKYRRGDVTPKVQILTERDEAFWRFAVSDNGIGIEPQYWGGDVQPTLLGNSDRHRKARKIGQVTPNTIR